jgi:hypothetical protein
MVNSSYQIPCQLTTPIKSRMSAPLHPGAAVALARQYAYSARLVGPLDIQRQVRLVLKQAKVHGFRAVRYAWLRTRIASDPLALQWYV